MRAVARKYNPGFLSDEELVATFCVRTCEFDSMMEVLRDCTGNANVHQLVLGGRGSGKTSLLLRIAAEIRRDVELSSIFFPVVLAEESYEVSTAGEFWLECLSRLADQAPHRKDGPDLQRTLEDLRRISNDRTLGDRCLGALQEFSDGEERRLVVIAENLNMLFADMSDKDAGWRLRQILQTEPRIVVLASATSRFDEIDNPERALYDLFRVISLCPLDLDACETLWNSVSSRARSRQTIRALRILTGGNPRLLTIVARFGAELSFRDLMSDLLTLVDDHTEFFKSHLDALPARERRVYLALADLWKPATTREIAERARLDTSKCSAFLVRLTERGAVEVTGGTPRRKLYYLTERLYNIYYLMRRSRGPAPLIEALIHFMEAYYSPSELKDLGIRIAAEASRADADTQSLYQTTLEKLLDLPSLAQHREELCSHMPKLLPSRVPDGRVVRQPTGAIQKLFNDAVTLASRGRLTEALCAWEQIEEVHGTSTNTADRGLVAGAMVNKGIALGHLRRYDDALATWDDVVERFERSSESAVSGPVARALVNKAAMLGHLRRPKEALAHLEEFDQRFGSNCDSAISKETIRALSCKGTVLQDLGRSRESLSVRDELLRKLEPGNSLYAEELIAETLVTKGMLLLEMKRSDQAEDTLDEVVRRFGARNEDSLEALVTAAQFNKGTLLHAVGRLEEAITAFGENLQRFERRKTPGIGVTVASSLNSMGATFAKLGRLGDAVEAWGKLDQLFDNEKNPAVLERVASSLLSTGEILAGMNQPENALAAWDKAMRRAETLETPFLSEVMAQALINKANLLDTLNRSKESTAVWDDVVQHFEKSNSPMSLGVVAQALVSKGAALARLNLQDQAIAIWDEVSRRFGKDGALELPDVVAIAQMHKGDLLLQRQEIDKALVAWEEAVQVLDASAEQDAADTMMVVMQRRAAELFAVQRFEEALKAWDEIVLRFGTSDNTSLLEGVASAKFNKGVLLADKDRNGEAIRIWNEVIEQFGQYFTQLMSDTVASSMFSKGAALYELGQQGEALDVWSAVVDRFGSSNSPVILKVVANSLLCKGTVLTELGRQEEALVELELVDRRIGNSEVPALRKLAEVALLSRSEIESRRGRLNVAAELAGRVLSQERPGSSENRWLGLLIRARVRAGDGDLIKCSRDIEAALEMLPGLDVLPGRALDALTGLVIDVGAEPMQALIEASPSADILLPLSTALARERGLEPRVAREVEEVAEDIRQDLAERRKQRGLGGNSGGVSDSGGHSALNGRS